MILVEHVGLFVIGAAMAALPVVGCATSLWSLLTKDAPDTRPSRLPLQPSEIVSNAFWGTFCFALGSYIAWLAVTGW